MNGNEQQTGVRPPIVAIVGHIDHGKSTLLDYIRKSHVVEGEAGGITQHLSAYEAMHKNASGEHNITFLDTPGHEAFAAMRSRGLEVADVAILVVSAEEGVKPQTLEALKLINEERKPYIVAFTKVDKPDSDIERAKMSMLEHQIFLEGLGGDVPWVAVSGKTGEGVPELLDLILLAAELEGLSADLLKPGEGTVIEARVDGRRGNTATLIIEDGSVESGRYIVSGDAVAPVRIMENFLGKAIKEASAGSPVRIVGFSTLPQVGDRWHMVETKKEAESEAAEIRAQMHAPAGPTAVSTEDEEHVHVVVPLVIKTDVSGTGDAVVHELEKLPKDERLEVRVVSRGVGTISEGDVKLVGAARAGEQGGIIVGFNVKLEPVARDLAERLNVEIGMFDIIYKLTEWLGERVTARIPRERTEEAVGSARVLKVFSTEKGKVVLGGKVDAGTLSQGDEVRIMRHDALMGHGMVISLQMQKSPVKKVDAGNEFGAQIKTSCEPAGGDVLEMFTVEFK